MKNEESKSQTTFPYQSKWYNQKRHCSFRVALCENKESQLRNLAKLDIKANNMKRHSVMLGQVNLQFGMFNFENEEADEDDEIDNIEEERQNENAKKKNSTNEDKKKETEEEEKEAEK